MDDIGNDKELIERLSLNDHNAFTEIYEHFWRSMLQIAWGHTKDKELAEDVVHEVFMRLWVNRKNKEIENIRGFLQTAIKYAIFSHYRKEKRRSDIVSENIIYVDFGDNEAELDAIFLSQYVKEVLSKMPEKPRLVFNYSREDGLKNKEIADLMAISEKGVEANLTRAIKFLKKHMKRDGLSLLIMNELLKNYLSK